MKINQTDYNEGDVSNRVPCSQCGRDYGAGPPPPPSAVSKETGRTYRPRKNLVIIEQQKVRASLGGVALSDNAFEALVNVVRAVGPEVAGLDPGDRVHVSGTKGADWVVLPQEHHLFITRDENCLVAWEEAP